MSSVPINSANAIDAVAFAIVFNREFNEKEQNKLLGLQKVFEKDLPQFSQDMLVDTKIESETVIKQDVKKSGIRLQKIEADGKISWVLHILSNQIIITCSSYDRWNNVWNNVDKYLKESVKLLDLADINVNAVVLQYIDKFTENNGKKYNVKNVFNSETEYLTSNVKNIGKLWHVHQGWFEDVPNKEKILHVLNLGTIDNSEKILTTIDHSLRLQFVEKPKVAKKFFDKNKEYKKTFELLHEKNKNLLKSLLNKKQCEAIGLV